MTYLEQYNLDHGTNVKDITSLGCPWHYNYKMSGSCSEIGDCTSCWNQEMLEEIKEETPSYVTAVVPRPSKEKATDDECFIRDSGDRTEFPSGAVRDMREGKGRCDLLPLDVVATHCGKTLLYISEFQKCGNEHHLANCLQHFFDRYYDNNVYTAYLEIAKHFEEGAKKYGDNNWQKGIPVRCYIDSAVRHYLKYLRGDKDEPHDRAFCWNILCAIWTCKHKPELNDYTKDEK